MKILFSFILACLSSYVYAQIQRNIGGIELGKSTKTDVSNLLYARGLYYVWDNEEQAYIVQDKISFGGYRWDYAAYFFYKDILCCVVFTEHADRGDAFEKMEKELKQSLHDKYKYLSKRVLHTDWIKKYVYKDKKTTLIFGRETYKYLKLAYKDNFLDKLKSKNSYDAL